MSDWIEHYGGPKPNIPRGRKFECKRRDGVVITSHQANEWVHKREPWLGDIVAFRFIDDGEEFVGIEQLQCFKQVADVIGHCEAVKQLRRVPTVRSDTELGAAFNWANSPQGNEFWRFIHYGKNPLCTKGKEPDMLVPQELVELYAKQTEGKEPDMGVMNTDGSDAMNAGVKHAISKSDGSTADYYELPKGATQLQDLIGHTDMNAQVGEIFRACYRYGRVAHSEKMRDAKKMKFYAEAEIKRLENLDE